jgi:diphthine synthase
MFSLIGLGLNPPASISVAALDALQTADVIYLENYTNLGITHQELSQFLQKPVMPAPRTAVESEDVMLEATEKNVALCIIGDVFSATTHSVLYIDCIKQGIPVEVYAAAGIMNSIGITGLELYKFGETISIPYPLQSFDPTSYVDKLHANKERGLHTLCLLDIKSDEGRYMTVREAVGILIGKNAVDDDTLMIGCARIGTDNVIKAGTPGALLEYSFGAQPHCIVVPGKLNAVEEEFIELWKTRP